jgi:predicted MFS family arabinose efflux permease
MAAADQYQQRQENGVTRDPALVVAVTTTVQALATMCTLVPATIAPELARAFGVPASLIGVQVSLIYLGALVMSMIGGQLVRRLGAARTSQMALMLAGSGLALSATASMSGFAIGSVLVGFGYGLTNPAASHLLMQVAKPKNRNIIFSLKQTGVPLGAVMAGLTMPSLTLAFGWQGAFLIAAAVTLGFMIAIQPLRRGWDRDRDPTVTLRQNPASDLRMVWGVPGLRWLSMASFCFSAVQISLSAFAVTMLVQDLRFGLVEAGIVLSVLQVAGATGRLAWGGVADWLGNGNWVLMGVGLIATAAGVMTMFLEPGAAVGIVYAVLMLFGLSAIGWNGVFLAEVARLAPEGKTGSATAGALVPTYAGVLLGPMSFAALHGLTGQYTVSFGIFAAISLAGAALILMAQGIDKGKVKATTGGLRPD